MMAGEVPEGLDAVDRPDVLDRPDALDRALGALRWSPLRQAHREAHRLLQELFLPRILQDRRMLYGRHLMRYPLMALLVSREMGPVRHAISQRTVAGTVLILAPKPERVPAAPGGVKPPSSPR